jgi:hypothetical protein
MRKWKRTKENYEKFCRSELWTTEAREIKRDNRYCCDGCGGQFPPHDLEVHHLDSYSHPNRDGTPDCVPEGWFPDRCFLECLCYECHAIAGGHMSWQNTMEMLDAIGEKYRNWQPS